MWTILMPLRPLLLVPLLSNENGDIELYKQFPFDKELSKTRNENKSNNRRKRNWNILTITVSYIFGYPRTFSQQYIIFQENISNLLNLQLPPFSMSTYFDILLIISGLTALNNFISVFELKSYSRKTLKRTKNHVSWRAKT